jgi:hypothetical protein
MTRKGAYMIILLGTKQVAGVDEAEAEVTRVLALPLAEQRRWKERLDPVVLPYLDRLARKLDELRD